MHIMYSNIVFFSFYTLLTIISLTLFTFVPIFNNIISVSFNIYFKLLYCVVDLSPKVFLTCLLGYLRAGQWIG